MCTRFWRQFGRTSASGRVTYNNSYHSSNGAIPPFEALYGRPYRVGVLPVGWNLENSCYQDHSWCNQRMIWSRKFSNDYRQPRVGRRVTRIIGVGPWLSMRVTKFSWKCLLEKEYSDMVRRESWHRDTLGHLKSLERSEMWRIDWNFHHN